MTTKIPGSAFLLAKVMAENKMEFRDDLCIDSRYLKTKKPFEMQNKKGESQSESFFGDIYLTAYNKDREKRKIKIPVALKMFLHFEGFNDSVQRKMKNSFESLQYEAKMYKFIFENIIKPNYSPNFISYISYGCCTLDSLVSSYISNTDIEKSIKNLLGNIGRRDIEFNPEKNKICMLITEKAGNGSQFETKNSTDIDNLDNFWSDLDKKSKLQVMFQIIYSVACMNLFRINHNDFHTGNILVAEFEKPISLSFEVKGQIFAFETYYIPYLFDWDFSYSSLLGKNPKILKTSHMNIFHDFHPCKDLYTLFCLLNFEGPVASQYKQPEVERTLEKTEISLTENQYEDIPRKFKPFIFDDDSGSSVYKVKVFDLIKEIGIINIDLESLDTLTTVYFILYTNVDKYILQFWEGFQCRWTTVDKDNLPTPVQLMLNKGNMFNKGIFEEFKSNSRNRFHYVLPTLETISPYMKDKIQTSIRDIEPQDFDKPTSKQLRIF